MDVSMQGACRVGVMGGTFDPPHVGHLALAGGVASALGLKRVLFMPTGNPNFKRGQHVTPAHVRAEMVALAIAGLPAFELDLREVKRAGVTYTVDTLLEMRAEQPDAQLYFILGADSVETLSKWRRAAQMVDLCTFVAVQRPGYCFARIRRALEESGLGFRVEYVEIDTPDVSSTQVRAAVKRGENVDGLVPAAVAEYIREHELYTR